MHRDAVDGGAAGPLNAGTGGIGVGRQAFSGLRDQAGGAGCGAGRRIGLLRMMQLDDFGGFEEPGGLLGEVH